MSKHTPGPWDDITLIALLDKPEEELEANIRLMNESPVFYDICSEFCRRVEIGEVRSKKTYAAMKEILNRIDECE